MTVLVIVLAVLLVAVLVVLGVTQSDRLRHQKRGPVTRTHRILFPFVAGALSQQALDAALRLAIAEDATLVPVFLARVSLDLPLDTPLPRQSGLALPLQEAIEHRAARFGVPVDSRIERGRTYRHALRQAIGECRYDRMVIAAATHDTPGFNADDVAWLLDNAPGEIVVLRPSTNHSVVHI
jgi:hypothetical protein